MKHPRKHLSTYLIGIAALLGSASSAWAQTAPALGAAANFAALGGTGVTCTSPNPPLPAVTINGGDVGSLLLAPTSVTGFPGFTPGANPCSLSGTVQLGAAAAYADFLTAYNALAGSAYACPSAIASHNLVGDLRSGAQGSVLEPGVYCISGVGLLTGQLTLAGPADAVWIFKAASSITAIGGSVVMANGGQAANVYWQLGTAATFDSNTDFAGNVLAGTAITFTGVGSSLCGRALAQTNVTLTGASISSVGSCGGTQPPPPPVCDKDHKRHKHHKYHKHNKHHKHHKDDRDQCDCDDDDGHGKGRHGDKDRGWHHGHPFSSNDDRGRGGRD